MLEFVDKDGNVKFLIYDEDNKPIELTEEEAEEYKRTHKKPKTFKYYKISKEIIDYHIAEEIKE